MINAIVNSLLKKGYSPKMAMLVAAQAAHETNNFTSRVYKANHNLFGMRVAKIRQTTTIGDTDGDSYANYKDVEQSINDIVLYHKARRISKTGTPSVQEYAQTLKDKKYYEDFTDNYARGLNRWLNYYFNNGTKEN